MTKKEIISQINNVKIKNKYSLIKNKINCSQVVAQLAKNILASPCVSKWLEVQLPRTCLTSQT